MHAPRGREPKSSQRGTSGRPWRPKSHTSPAAPHRTVPDASFHGARRSLLSPHLSPPPVHELLCSRSTQGSRSFSRSSRLGYGGWANGVKNELVKNQKRKICCVLGACVRLEEDWVIISRTTNTRFTRVSQSPVLIYIYDDQGSFL
jgi:hypothetical protein